MLKQAHPSWEGYEGINRISVGKTLNLCELKKKSSNDISCDLILQVIYCMTIFLKQRNYRDGDREEIGGPQLE